LKSSADISYHFKLKTGGFEINPATFFGRALSFDRFYRGKQSLFALIEINLMCILPNISGLMIIAMQSI
jgi:hypothetical protein